MNKINLYEKFNEIKEHWDPHILYEMNGQFVKLAKFKGEFVWHHHDNEDEFFMVIKGKFQMHLAGQIIDINEGETILIPKGTEHKPVATEEVWVMLFEPNSTLNTGNIENVLTKSNLRTF